MSQPFARALMVQLTPWAETKCEVSVRSLRFFYSYSHHDETYRRTLGAHLKLLEREGFITSWHDRKITAGTEWKGEIDRHLEEADVILFLVSADFLDSDYCWDKEVKRAIERNENGEARIVPIIIRAVDWELAPFAKYQPLPKGGKPVTSWPVADEAWANIAQGIRAVVSEVTAGPRPKLSPSSVVPRGAPLPNPLPASDLPNLRNLPFESLGSLFKGRDDALEQLAGEFVPGRAARRLLIDGLGGIGKTRLAVEYAWRYGFLYSALFFVRSDSPESLSNQLAALAGPDLLCLPERQATEEETGGAVKRWLRDHPGWLLILDGIDTQEAADAVSKLLPRLVGGHVLLTSRRALTFWPASLEEQQLVQVSDREAALFLLDRTKGRREMTPDDAIQAEALAKALGALPLALEQAAAYIARNQITFAEYLDAWERERPEVLEWYDPLVMQYDASVAVTWQKSFLRLPPVSRALLRLTGYLAPEPIPIPMFIAGTRIILEAALLLCTEIGQSFHELPLRDALAELMAYSLGTLQGQELLVHRVVQDVLRTHIPGEFQHSWVERSIGLVDSFLPLDPESLHTWPGWDLLRPHAAKVLEHADRAGILEPTARLRNHLGLLLKARGLYPEAEALGRRALEVAVKTCGPQDRAVAVELNNLASVLKAMGRLEEAEPLYRRALQIDELSLDPRDLEIATDLNNLALLLKAMDHKKDAEPLLRRALGIFEESLGSDNPRTRAVLNHLVEIEKPTEKQILGQRDKAELAVLNTVLGDFAYADFSLKIEPKQDGEYPVLVLGSPVGEGRGRLRITSPSNLGSFLDHIGSMLDEVSNSQASERRRTSEEVGEILFNALFSGEVRQLFEQSLGWAEARPGCSLRLIFHLDPSHPDLAALMSLPWELLHWRERREFLSLGRRSPVVRSLDVPRPFHPLRLESSLRVLVVSALPQGVEPLDFERECRQIEEALIVLPQVEVAFLHHATPESLRGKLFEAPFHVLHFIGHGVFQKESGEGSLVFENCAGDMVLLPGRLMAEILRDFAELRLVFLNTCDGVISSRHAGVDPFAGVAAALVMSGLPSVLAMQSNISDEAAIAFSAAFYRRLAAGDRVDTATVEGRMAIRMRDSGSLEWAIPVLYLQSTSGKLFEPPTVLPKDPFIEIRRHIIDFSSYVAEKTVDFVGRGWWFGALERFICEHSRGYFIIRGEPGIGKATFLAEMVRRGMYPHHFNIRAAGIQGSEAFLGNLCAQLIVRYNLDYTSLPPEATLDGRFLSVILSQVSGKLAPGEKVILAVGSLDEADPAMLAPGTNILYLPMYLPPGVYVVATTRRGLLPLRIDCEQEVFDVSQDSEGNLADMRELVVSKLDIPGIRAYIYSQRLDERSFVEKIVEKSQGNFIYLRYLLPEIEGGVYKDLDFGALPRGLDNFYESEWIRMRTASEEHWFTEQVPVLVALTLSKEPISIELIATLSGIAEHRMIRAVLRDWEAFLYTTVVEENGERKKLYRFYHASFQDFIAAKDEVAGESVDLKAAHTRIADVLWKELDGET